MWTVTPVGWASRTYRVEDGHRHVGSVELGHWKEQGAIEHGGRRLEVRREGFWNPRFHLLDGRETRATARRIGVFRSGFHVAHGDEELALTPGSFFSRAYELTRRGRSLGRVRPHGMFSRKLDVELDEELAPELRLFTVWLVVLAWRRAAAAAAAG